MEHFGDLFLHLRVLSLEDGVADSSRLDRPVGVVASGKGARMQETEVCLVPRGAVVSARDMSVRESELPCCAGRSEFCLSVRV